MGAYKKIKQLADEGDAESKRLRDWIRAQETFDEMELVFDLENYPEREPTIFDRIKSRFKMGRESK